MISSYKARFIFEDYQTFYANNNLYAFKNGEEFHAIMIEDAATMEQGAQAPPKRQFNPKKPFEYSGFALAFDKSWVYVAGGFRGDDTTN